MGWDQREIRISGHVSKHNSEQDKIDENLFEELENRILMIIKENRYKSLSLNIL